ncbi:mitochondrial amino-acid acetyltransferase [Punctularia strigosozonata HHB-11173 SS5]|uniref:mitochondrial amino-acid acetyltransferase n=1 Tax=Punctularia strigosozonata (strain HHB-11173) TaxID=741275 RepID=UPI00044167BB|nr:mitochondrial amino-acid acetyltransferase [Punctularia strigosozonata HHB-11173 SS5]EIN14092.1 mitochondrial amino-acid acetyltransferase [Punctularia strigosozonata HHB-11173 SS5]
MPFVLRVQTSACSLNPVAQTIRDLRPKPAIPNEPSDDSEPVDNDIILSILRANPSARDAKLYLASFGSPVPRIQPEKLGLVNTVRGPSTDQDTRTVCSTTPPTSEHDSQTSVIASILNPIHRRTALVKVQGPFTDRQLESIARGIVYLEKLGLLSVIVVENCELERGHDDERGQLMEETMRVTRALEEQGAKARPILSAVVRLGPKPGDEDRAERHDIDLDIPEAHTVPGDLIGIRSALLAGEIPVLPPMALDSFVRSIPINANDVVAALARGMVEAAAIIGSADGDNTSTGTSSGDSLNLTPLRLMIINREGGIPSYARSGLPHLLVNTTAEYRYIHETFSLEWKKSHPTALANLSLARTCLSYMPPSSSAVMVSHRSPSSLIANLITNKPAVSSSLPHALGNRRITQHTPTLLRRGLPIRVVRNASDIDKAKMKNLLEQSFKRTLNEYSFWSRLERDMDFTIIAGDYAGAAIVTNEAAIATSSFSPIAYLDKFAVLPSHQGDGTVDFLWVALHDESYGLGLPFSANPNGGKGGQGEGRDLVWRSRADNPVNKWYFERSTGHVRMDKDWVMFWCDAEVRLKMAEGRKANAGLSYVEDWERGRLGVWNDTISKIPSVWK